MMRFRTTICQPHCETSGPPSFSSTDSSRQIYLKSGMLGTQTPGTGNWGKSFGQRTDMDSVPLFEREHRNDSQLVQRLQNELADAKRFVEAQARRQNDLEYVNEDLERRLEQEALERITLDAQKAEDEKRWQREKVALQEQLQTWEARFEEETRRRSMAEERLRRAEKELYRMHQKKYDIEKQVRREESEKRKHEAVIVRSLQSDSQRAQLNAASGFLDPTVNPKDAKPAAVRTRQALSSAMDFLGRGNDFAGRLYYLLGQKDDLHSLVKSLQKTGWLANPGNGSSEESLNDEKEILRLRCVRNDMDNTSELRLYFACELCGMCCKKRVKSSVESDVILQASEIIPGSIPQFSDVTLKRNKRAQQKDCTASSKRHHILQSQASTEGLLAVLSSHSLSPQTKQLHTRNMPLVVDTIYSPVITSKHACQSFLEPESNTQPKQAVLPVQTQQVLSCYSDAHSPYDRNMVQFSGLYVVRGPTAPKHLRYTMEITIAKLHLRSRCIQRFQSFFLLRKRLLKILKTRLPSRKTLLDETPFISANYELVEFLTRPRSIQCHECESTYRQLASVKFPRRTLLSPSSQDVQERSQLLETFLDHCVQIATRWAACQRSKRMFVATLGTFLGVDLTTLLNNQKEVLEVRCVKDEKNDLALTKANDGAMLSPSLQDKSDHGDDFKDDRHSEPNFTFISDLSGHNNVKRSQSHR
ncbi:hypothetical protein Plhal710r2_c051g0157571 [Plasmopara halstedii]